MSEGDRTAIDDLPHIKDEHIKILGEEGLLQPDKLLSALKDEEKWKELHPKLKGIGPKTHEKWIELLEAGAESAAEPEEPPKKAKIERKVKVPTERKEPVKKPEEEEEKELEEEAEEPEEAEEEAEEEETAEVVEEGGYTPHKKPTLPAEVRDALAKRKVEASNRPKKFLRQEYHRYVRLKTGWRRPKGLHSKARKKLIYRRKKVSVGYGSPKLARDLHPSGFEEVPIFNVKDLDKIDDPERQAARIGHSVGQRKRENIVNRADELGIRVLNRS